MNDMVPRKDMVKYGMQAAGGVVGGIALLVLNGLSAVPSLIVGGAVAVLGLIIGSDKKDKLAGTIVTVAGLITAATAIPLLGGIAGFLMKVSGIGLLIMGGLNLWKFIKGYKKI